MILKDHIAYRFLTDPTLALEMIETMHPEEYKILVRELAKDDLKEDWEPEDFGISSQALSMYHGNSPFGNINYWITDTVLSKLDMLKVGKIDGAFNWKVFDKLADCKKTFIFPNNSFLRMNINDLVIHFTYVRFQFTKGDRNNGYMNWDMFYVERETGRQVNDYNAEQVSKVETMIYKLLCFLFLTENDEVIIPAGTRYGTKKDGKIINSLNVPITVVNSRWNTTVIRNEGFAVSGHFRVQPFGPKMSQYKIIFIEPFTKNGYVRKSKSSNL